MARRLAILTLLVVAVTGGACGDRPATTLPAAPAGSTGGYPAAVSPSVDSAGSAAGSVSPAAPSRPATLASIQPRVAVRVSRVLDGDTLKVDIAGRTDTVRVIGLDTPESVKPGTPVECFALRASAEAKRLLPVGAAIRLQADPTQATRRRYGRLLAHVWLADGTLYAERMIRGGFGIHFVYGGVPSIYASRLAGAEVVARAALTGLWSPRTCAGNAHTPAA
jgi:micrococcal nuclease